MWNTAAFLFEDPGVAPEPGKRLLEQGSGPTGFLRILLRGRELADEGARELEDYFALCLAAHHATVATFVPTDVDSKIRGLLWLRSRDPEVLRPMCDLALRMPEWDLSRNSRRTIEVEGLGLVSGHNGEWFSVVSGALGHVLTLGDVEYIEKTAEAIDRELEREAEAFRRLLATPGREIDVWRLAASLTHNVGDLDQGISYWSARGDAPAKYKARFSRLAHENASPYGGSFQTAAKLYKDWLSSEGHRHYPLRAVRSLRKGSELLLPLGPFFDGWGATIGTTKLLTTPERAEVLDALVRGCRKVANQVGYYRAVAGFAQADRQEFERASRLMPVSAQKDLRDPKFRQHIALAKPSFESIWKKRVAAIRPSAGRY